MEAEMNFRAGTVNTSNKELHTSTSFSVSGVAAVLLEDRSLAATLNAPFTWGRTNVWRVWETVKDAVGHRPVLKVPLEVSNQDKTCVISKSLKI